MDAGYDEIENGWVVYSADNRRLGTVEEVNWSQGYVGVHRGRVFTQTMYVPLDGIARAGHGSVHLIYDQAQIEARDWDTAPAPRVSAPEGGERDEPTVVVHAVGETIPATPDGEVSVLLHEEELEPARRTVEAGRLRVHKQVAEEPELVTVGVRHDEVEVERVPMDDDYAGDEAFQERLIEIPLMAERLVVDKRARVVEEVRVYKRSVVEEHEVRDTVRKERVSIEEHRADDA